MKISYEDFHNIPWKQRNGIYEVENYATYYYVNGELHREDGPASVLINGNGTWFFNGKYHRLDGPAIKLYDGRGQYYIEGLYYSTKKEFKKAAYLYKNGLQDYL